MAKAKNAAKKRSARKAAPVKVAGSATDPLNAQRDAAAATLKVGDAVEVASGQRRGERAKVVSIVGGYVDARMHTGELLTFDAYKLRAAWPSRSAR